jgi:hypothetical protein
MPWLNLLFKDSMDRPLANEPFRLVFEGRERWGRKDGDGVDLLRFNIHFCVSQGGP